MSVEKPFDGEVIEGFGSFQLSRGGVDRTKWKFDQDGFKLGTEAALLRAQQELQETIKSIHQDLVSTANPVDYDVTVGGVPIDKAMMQR